VRIYTEEEQKLAGGTRTKPPLPDNKSFVSSRISKTGTNTKSISYEEKDAKTKETTRLVTKSDPKNPGLSPLPKSEELKGYMRPKSTRPGSSKQRDSVTSRPSTSSRPNSARPPSKEKKKKQVPIHNQVTTENSRPHTVSTDQLTGDIPALPNTSELAAEVENYKSTISQLEKRIQTLEESNAKLVKEKERIHRDLDNHLKANLGERSGLDQLKIQFAEQHAQNASLIVHNRYSCLIRSLKTQICELEALIETMLTSCSPEHVVLAKQALKQLS
jgi:hypothetical protein